LLRYVILHEILHAYGLGAHVDPDEHPLSVMRPTTERFEDVPPVFVSLDGEALLAETHVAPGTPVSAIAAGDLGPWTDTAFHLLGHAEPGDTGDGLVRFGAGFRNGLAKPWVWGPVPDGRLGDNPGLSGTAAWTGALLGFSGSGRTVAGDALVRIDIGSLDGSAAFSNLESWGRFAHPGRPGSGTMWGDGDLGYSIEVVHGEAGDGFVSASAPGDDPGVVTGAFVGAAHEGAAGVLEHPDLSAAFGATR
ncbi:MAG: hypothetical protein OXJ64_14850, partial [Boseongicola sp.]|nr:hypothetical protein [Boseongicola sp.]